MRRLLGGLFQRDWLNDVVAISVDVLKFAEHLREQELHLQNFASTFVVHGVDAGLFEQHVDH